MSKGIIIQYLGKAVVGTSTVKSRRIHMGSHSKNKNPGYCIHCNHRIGIASICTACGTLQQEADAHQPVKIEIKQHPNDVRKKQSPLKVSAKRPSGKVIDILLGIATWLDTAIAVAFLGKILGLTNSEGILKIVYLLAFCCLPVIVTIIVVAPERLKSNQLIRETEPTPIKKSISLEESVSPEI